MEAAVVAVRNSMSFNRTDTEYSTTGRNVYYFFHFNVKPRKYILIKVRSCI